jgi:large subunit ribosomal protein L29
MKAKEMRAMTKEELEERVIELKQELAKERSTIASGTRSEKPSKIKNIKKDIARLLTVMNTKEIK